VPPASAGNASAPQAGAAGGSAPAGTLPEPKEDLEPEASLEPEPVAAAAPGTSVATRRQPMLTPAPQPTGPRVISPVRKPVKEWGVKPANPNYVGPKTPTDVKIVVVALIIAIIVAAIIIGILSSSTLIAVIVAVIALVLTLGVIVFSRL
jgi:hypothetical protein